MFFEKLSTTHKDFISRQHMFFVATSPKSGRINLSPKGMDSLRIIDEHTISWLNLTGSGNETAAHLLENGRITLMMCAFEGKPNILRIYGTGYSIYPSDPNWDLRIQLFPDLPGVRQIVDITIESVQDSCGFAVPFYDFKSQRDQLTKWATHKGEEGVKKYWSEKNTKSIDGLETGILDRS